jgi:hypothetical protein
METTLLAVFLHPFKHEVGQPSLRGLYGADWLFEPDRFLIRLTSFNPQDIIRGL